VDKKVESRRSEKKAKIKNKSYMRARGENTHISRYERR
jgi:hypothetical protein